MISNATKRAILRTIHLVVSIPVLGYVYSPFAELPKYAPWLDLSSFQVLILSGFWMYAGLVFAIIGVAVWLGAIYLSGIGTAYPESGRAIHRAQDLVGGSCATVKSFALTNR